MKAIQVILLAMPKVILFRVIFCAEFSHKFLNLNELRVGSSHLIIVIDNTYSFDEVT
jgi:hypothetical protein